MQKLALTLFAEVGETPTSLASRVAARNFVSARDLARDFGISFQKIVDGDELEIRRLADLSNAEIQDLLPNAIRKIGTMYELRGQSITNRRSGVPRFISARSAFKRTSLAPCFRRSSRPMVAPNGRSRRTGRAPSMR